MGVNVGFLPPQARSWDAETLGVALRQAHGDEDGCAVERGEQRRLPLRVRRGAVHAANLVVRHTDIV